ncbi:MAG TPA: SPOR domain-containing protein [Bdellovibrionota bacterium]|jgi:hypothetical protein|nr:SPOR domain-containing protein [Bdellovibrionota bacterium]
MKPKGEWTSMRRKDLGLLLVVGFLFASLTFNLGIYWGIKWGLNHSPQASSAHSAPATPAHGHGGVVEAANHPASEAVTPEVDWHTKKQIPAEITEAFVKSKQSALIESQLRSKDRTPVGISIADAETYFREKKLPWGEVPKELANLDRQIASESKKASENGAKKEASGLFERSPASVKSFKPIPGQSTVQVASYATEEEAVARVNLLISSGMSDAYYTKTKVKNEFWYQVAVGSYKDKSWAQKTGERMVHRSLASEYFVRKVPD